MPDSPLQRWTLAAAVLFLAGAVGYFAGSRTASGTERPPGAGSVEVGFLQDMLGHHQQAIEMSNLELQGPPVEAIRPFATEILYQQGYEIGVMERTLRAWGHQPSAAGGGAMGWMGREVAVDEMPGMASEVEMAALAAADPPVRSALFVRLMQDHHRGGVHMAEAAAAMARDPFVRDLAGRMARNQRIEIAELDAALLRAGLPADPNL